VYNFVACLYHHCLKSKSCPDSNYFSARGFDSTIQNTYKLGYCPAYFINTEDKVLTLKDCLLQSFPDIPSTVLDSYGLYDNFGTSVMAGRFVFTIFDSKGNAIGFSGRSLDPALPKYVNTSNTEFFKKSEVLYNYHEAKKYSSVIIVEGYCDALSLISKGIKNVVACMGTAFTTKHFDLLKGKEFILALDNDNAGYTQMYNLIINNKYKLFNVWLWNGAKDFNELLLTNPEKFNKIIDNKKLVSAPEFLIHYLKSTLDLSILENRNTLWLELAYLIGANSKLYQAKYPINTIYTPVAIDYYWTIVKRIIKGKRGF
jgi:DNA primase catalytic core